MARELSLCNYLHIAGGEGENRWIHAFFKGISAKCNSSSLVQDLHSKYDTKLSDDEAQP